MAQNTATAESSKFVKPEAAHWQRGGLEVEDQLDL